MLRVFILGLLLHIGLSGDTAHSHETCKQYDPTIPGVGNSGCTDTGSGWVAMGINLSNAACMQDCIDHCNKYVTQNSCCCLNVPGRLHPDHPVCVVKPGAMRDITEDGTGGWGMDCGLQFATVDQSDTVDLSTIEGYTPNSMSDVSDKPDSAEAEVGEEQMLSQINEQYWNRNYMVAGIFATALCLGSLSVKLEKKIQKYNEQRITNEFKIMED